MTSFNQIPVNWRVHGDESARESDFSNWEQGKGTS